MTSLTNADRFLLWQVVVTYLDGDTRDFSDDTRVSYTLLDSDCADMSANVLTTRPGIGCASLRVTVSIPAFITRFEGVFTQNVTIPIVRLQSVAVDFHAYDPNMASVDVPVTQLGRIECTSEYHDAVARARAYLSDSSAARDRISRNLP